MKQLEFQIAYKRAGKIITERVFASNNIDAQKIAKEKGIFVACTYIESESDRYLAEQGIIINDLTKYILQM